MGKLRLVFTFLLSLVFVVHFVPSLGQDGSSFDAAIVIEAGKEYVDQGFAAGSTKFFLLQRAEAGRRISVEVTFKGSTGLVDVIIYSHLRAGLSEVSQVVSEGRKLSVNWTVSHRDAGRPFYVRFSKLTDVPLTYSFVVNFDDLSDTGGFDAGDDMASAVGLGKVEVGKSTAVRGHLTLRGGGNDFTDVYKFEIPAIPGGEKVRIVLSVSLSEFFEVATTLTNAIGTELASTIGTSISKEVDTPGAYFVKLTNREGGGGSGVYQVSIELFSVKAANTTATSAFPTRIPIVLDPTSLGFTVATMGIVAIVVVAFVAAALRRRKIYRVE